jgi:hypothetical protein
MNKYLLLILLLTGLNVYGQNKSINVITHNKTTVTTDPSGVKKFPAWAVFPTSGTEIRKILMHVTLGCPDTLPCAHWDYLDHITLLKAGGKNGKELGYELGRMLTPYGSIYNKGWDFTWTVDVTDFAMVLRDSVLIEYAHSGYEPSTVGWALTLDFEVVTGKPVMRPISITQLWKDNFRYGDSLKSIETRLTPISYLSDESAKINRIRIQQTGHGMDRPKGCSEFCSRWRELRFDGKTIDHRDLWKECGSNPLYPQGGTWIFDRGWWCPGDLQPADIYDQFVQPGEHSVDIDMQPYTAEGESQANESIASYLIQYGAPSNANDVAIEEIVVPNNKKNFNRMNPACFNPRIMIRNLGRENLKTLTIEYSTVGKQKRKFIWKGDLSFNQATEVILPGEIETTGAKSQFNVILSKPNGKKDGWEGDNSMTSTFDAPIVLPENMILQLLTNNNPTDNSIFIINSKGDTIFHKKPADLKVATLYNDTLKLSKGNYELTLTDTAGNGLEFWYEFRQGYGYMRLLDMEGRLLHNFESDCGNGQFLSFTASPDYVTDTCKTEYAFVLYPRRTKDTISLDYHADKAGVMEIIITADGVEVEKHIYQHAKRGKFTYNVDYLPKGRYIIDVIIDGESRFKRRFNKE